MSTDDRQLVEQLLERRLKKHSGDAHQSLIAAASRATDVNATLDRIRNRTDDAMIQQTLGDIQRPRGGGAIEYVSMISQPPTSRDRYTLSSTACEGRDRPGLAGPRYGDGPRGRPQGAASRPV